MSSEHRSEWTVTDAGRITRAPYMPVPIDRPEPEPPIPAKPLPLPVREEPTTLADKIASAWRMVRIGYNLTPYLVKLFVGAKMKNWKTTLGAIVGGIATVLNVLGIIEISAEIQMALVTIGLFIVGLFAGDAKKNESDN